MRTKIAAAFVAGGVLVAAGFVVSAVSTPSPARAQEGSDDEREGPVGRILGFLDEVLDDLVGEGTITEDQADAIAEAAEDKAAEVREQHLGLLDQLGDLLDDGLITEDEASELPDDHWLFGDAFEEAWADGELTRDELRAARPRPFGHGFRHGLRLGSWLDDGGIDQEEYDSLPDDHPLKQLDLSEYLDDGEITPDEFREIFSDLHNSFRGEDA